MITRENAIDVINDLICADVLSDEKMDALSDIRLAIEEERLGRHVWGAPDEWISKLHVAVREDLITDELINEYEKIHKGLVFNPSTFETKEIRDNIREDMENSTDEEVTDADIEWFLTR